MVRNIIIINDFAHINGGAGKVAISSAVGLSGLGYNVVLFSAVPPVCKELAESNVKVVCLGQCDILSDANRARAMVNGVWNRLARKEFRKLLSAYNPGDTVVHYHAWIKALSASVLNVAAKCGFRSVVTLHDYFLFCPNGGLFNYRTLKICDRKASSLGCLACNCDARNYPQKVWRYIRQMVQWHALKKAGKVNVIYISELNRKVSLPYLRGVTGKWYYVSNPVELGTGAKVDIASNKKYLCIARLSKEKGVELFCKAMEELHLEGCVLGDGYLMEELKGKYKNVDFVGWVDGREKEEYLGRATCLVFPSLWYEGAPLTVLEMMSYGIPCIVPDRCAASEEIDDGRTGYVFKSGNLESLKAAIMKYEKSGKQHMQDRIAETFDADRFTLASHCRRLVEVYADILSTDRGRAYASLR